jgi:hypothetical protein
MYVRILPLIATTASSLLFLAAAAVAAPRPSYVAELAAPTTAVKLVSSDRLWGCEGVLCAAAGPADSAARHICSRLAKEVGPLKSFAVRGRAFDADQLAACNARAGAVPTMAAQ